MWQGPEVRRILEWCHGGLALAKPRSGGMWGTPRACRGRGMEGGAKRMCQGVKACTTDPGSGGRGVRRGARKRLQAAVVRVRGA